MSHHNNERRIIKKVLGSTVFSYFTHAHYIYSYSSNSSSSSSSSRRSSTKKTKNSATTRQTPSDGKAPICTVATRSWSMSKIASKILRKKIFSRTWRLLLHNTDVVRDERAFTHPMDKSVMFLGNGGPNVISRSRLPTRFRWVVELPHPSCVSMGKTRYNVPKNCARDFAFESRRRS